MNLLLIPGEGKDSNEQWLGDIEQKLLHHPNSPFQLQRHSTRLSYAHWYHDDQEFDPQRELFQLRLKLDTYGSRYYFVFAKSAGSVLFLQALADGAPKPVGAVFAGVPLPQDPASSMYKQYDVGELLKRHTVPTVIIQNADERFRKPVHLCASLAKWGATSCEVVVGTDPGHSYSVDTVVHHVLKQVETVMPR
ncbi:MAG: hypothetical protein Q7R76_02275 [Candidatus Woesearchaeota archaeon]|nr:hypothetical protein [Candidatus Woesearchaeota archaeon]